MTETEICKKYTPYIHSLAKRYARCNRRHYDDIVQAGFVGLLIAARKWREDMGASLMTYATPWIKEHMARVLDEVGGVVRLPKTERKDRGKVSSVANTTGSQSEGDEPPNFKLEGALSTPATQEAALAEHERAAIVRKTVGTLPKRYREMVTAVLVDGCTYRDAAEKFGCSPQYVCNVVRDSREDLQRRLESKLSPEDFG